MWDFGERRRKHSGNKQWVRDKGGLRGAQSTTHCPPGSRRGGDPPDLERSSSHCGRTGRDRRWCSPARQCTGGALCRSAACNLFIRMSINADGLPAAARRCRHELYDQRPGESVQSEGRQQDDGRTRWISACALSGVPDQMHADRLPVPMCRCTVMYLDGRCRVLFGLVDGVPSSCHRKAMR